jgi:hypothetical protein
VLGFSRHTSISLLADEVLDSAPVRHIHLLFLDGSTAIIEALGLIHSLLQSITLPSEHVIGVGTIASGTAFKAPHEWVGTARRPHAIELGRIPDSLEGHLGHTDWMRRGALGCAVEAFGVYGVIHVRFVIWAVEVLAIPASTTY